MTKRALCLLAAAAALLCCAALFVSRPGGGAEPAVSENFRLGTFVRLSLYDCGNADEELAKGDELIKSLENLFSVNIPTSDVARLNAAGGAWTRIDARTAELLEASLALAELTGGAFSPALGGVTALWRIGTPEARVPSDGEIAEALKHTDYSKIELRVKDGARFARLPRGMRLDLGAIAKGCVADALKSRFAADGVRRAMIDLGGNLDFVGEYFGIIEAEDVSVVTSGPYERYFEKDGVRYHHIIDPATGRPARSGLSSVTVIDANSARADALCTALFVMGSRRAPEFLRKHGYIKAVLVTDDKKVIITPSVEKIFRLTDESLALSVIGAGE